MQLTRPSASDEAKPRRAPRWIVDVIWAAACVATALLVDSLLRLADTGSTSMFLLAAVIFASVGRGVRAGLLAAIGGFAVYDYVWLPPIHTIAFQTPEEIVALTMFLGLALLTAVSSGTLRDRERRSAARQERLLAFARKGDIFVLPPASDAAGEIIAAWVQEIVGAGVYYLDADGRESRAGDASRWWENVQQGLRNLADQALERPGVTLKNAELRGRALSDGDVVLGALVWRSPPGSMETRREIDDVIAVVAEIAGAALGRARREAAHGRAA